MLREYSNESIGPGISGNKCAHMEDIWGRRERYDNEFDSLSEHSVSKIGMEGGVERGEMGGGGRVKGHSSI